MGERQAEAAHAPAREKTAVRRDGVPATPLFQRAGNRAFGRILASGRVPLKPRERVGDLPPAAINGVTEAAAPAISFPPLPVSSVGAFPIQRKCSHCEEEEMQRKAADGPAPLQRKCAKCEEEEGRQIQRKQASAAPPAKSPAVQQVLSSPGQPLDSRAIAFMEPRFGRDFSRVRVHTDSNAASSARELNAQAYTVGEHVVFASGRYAPATQAGRSLLAHELTHVAQQQNGFRTETGSAADLAEQEALANEHRIESGMPLGFSARPARLARKDESTVTVQAPQGPPGCTLEQHQKIEPAVRMAIQWLDASIKKLSTFISQPEQNQATGNVLERHFYSKDPGVARRVMERLQIIRHDADSAQAGREIKTECHDATDKSCDSSIAYSRGDSLVYCPSFFTSEIKDDASTLVHELAHSIFPNQDAAGGFNKGKILDRAYRGDRVLGKAGGKAILSPAEALANADSFALLVRELGTGELSQIPVTEDSFERSCREIEPMVRVAIARAERWNGAGGLRINSASPAMVQKHLGADTPQIRSDAAKFYEEARQGFSHSFKFKCDRDCGQRLAFGEAEDSGLKWLGLGAGAGALIGGLIALAGAGTVGLIVGAALFVAGLITSIVKSHGPTIHVCPRWKDQADEKMRIETMLVAAYEALGKSSADSLKYARLAEDLNQEFYPVPSMQELDKSLLENQLKRVRARLKLLREQYDRSMDAFVQSVTGDRERESLARGAQDAHKLARQGAAEKKLWGGSFAGEAIRKVATASGSGQSITLRVNLEIEYLALSDAEGRKHAADDIPRIEEAISKVWQVKITQGEYEGVNFRLVPSVTYLAKGAQRAPNTVLIQVRGPDKNPSEGDWHGIISLAQNHLVGPRVIVVAHELAHVFGFIDTYASEFKHQKGKPDQEIMTVGRPDAANRPDLLGMIDPVYLERKRKEGAVTTEQVKRQTGEIHIWEEEASTVLQTLGVAPPERPRPTPDSEGFDPADELDRVQRGKESELDRIRKQRKRIDDSMESVNLAEEIIKLEQEERNLSAQLKAIP